MKVKKANGDALGVLDRIEHQLKTVRSPLTTTQLSGRLMTKKVSFGNAVFTVYSIGYLATALNRSTHTIRRWQRAKLICKPLIQTADGSRWYLKEEIEMYARIVRQCDLQTGISIEQTGFAKDVGRELEVLRDNLQRTAEAKQTT